MRDVLNQVPGLKPAFSQPIEMRLNELIAGIRGDIGIKVYGDDLEELRRLGGEVQAVLAGIRGASEASVEQLTGQTFLQVRVDPQAIARYGVPTRNVLNVVEAVGSRRVGDVREGQRRFPLVVRLPDRQRTDPDALAATLIPTAAGPVLPLNQVAKITEMEGPSTINREWGKRRITVQCNVRGRDVKSFVAEGRAKIAAQVKLPEGYTIEWGGQFENMERANRKLMFVVPMALALIFVLLFFSLKTVREVLIVASGIPLGLVGGVLALWLRGLPFTVSSAIGFIALSGVAILNGLVLVTFIKQKLDDGHAAGASRARGLPGAAASGADDGAGGGGGFHPDGGERGRGRRSAAPAGHGGHRRHLHQHAADAAGVAGALPHDAAQKQCGGFGWRLTNPHLRGHRPPTCLAMVHAAGSVGRPCKRRELRSPVSPARIRWWQRLPRSDFRLATAGSRGRYGHMHGR